MKIQPNCSVYSYNNNSVVRNRRSPVIMPDSVSFSANTQVEKSVAKDITELIHQTALGRELKTKLFVRDYVQNLKNRDVIRIVSGGCSSGEEPVTYSMLLHGMRDKVDILGIDLGKNAISQAKSRKFVFEVPKMGTNLLEHFDTLKDSPFSDAYLFNSTNNGLNAEQSYFKSLFQEHFEPTGRKIRTPFWEWLHNKIEKRAGYNPLELDRFEYRLKEGSAQNCRYVQGDIRDIDTLTDGKKSDVISFNNALYHLTTFHDDEGIRIKKYNNDVIVEDLMLKFRNNLNDDGIVVFGENEGVQLLDNEVVPRVMTRLNFEPLNRTSEHEANVWKVLK